jgi:hypothetical protein
LRLFEGLNLISRALSALVAVIAPVLSGTTLRRIVRLRLGLRLLRRRLVRRTATVAVIPAVTPFAVLGRCIVLRLLGGLAAVTPRGASAMPVFVVAFVLVVVLVLAAWLLVAPATRRRLCNFEPRFGLRRRGKCSKDGEREAGGEQIAVHKIDLGDCGCAAPIAQIMLRLWPPGLAA